MKKLSLILAISVLGAGFIYAQQKKTTKPPADKTAQETIRSIEMDSPIPADNVQCIGADHKQYTLRSQLTKKGLLVMFSCNTCPYVIKSQARTKEIMAYAQKIGLGMVIVNSNEAQREGDDAYEAMVDYSLRQQYTVPYILDNNGKIAEGFGATRTPEVFLFNPEGRLVYKGAMEDNPADPASSKAMYLKNAIDNLVAGKTISPNSTKSIGCTIKRKA